MSFTSQQIRDAYKKLPEEALTFVTDNEVTDIISAALKKAGLSEDQSTLGDSELLYAMLGLQTLDAAISNISQAAGKKPQDFEELKKKLQEEVFDKLSGFSINQAPSNGPIVITKDTKKEAMEELKRRGAATPASEPAVIHNSLPVVEEGEKVHEVAHDAKLDTMPKPAAPAPATPLSPTAPSPASQASKLRPSSDTKVEKAPAPASDYRYPGGTDPYREPLA